MGGQDAQGSRYRDIPIFLLLLLRLQLLGLQECLTPSYSAALPAPFPLRCYFSPSCSLPPSMLPAPTPQQAQEMALPTPPPRPQGSQL